MFCWLILANSRWLASFSLTDKPACLLQGKWVLKEPTKRLCLSVAAVCVIRLLWDTAGLCFCASAKENTGTVYILLMQMSTSSFYFLTPQCIFILCHTTNFSISVISVWVMSQWCIIYSVYTVCCMGLYLHMDGRDMPNPTLSLDRNVPTNIWENHFALSSEFSHTVSPWCPAAGVVRVGAVVFLPMLRQNLRPCFDAFLIPSLCSKSFLVFSPHNISQPRDKDLSFTSTNP